MSSVGHGMYIYIEGGRRTPRSEPRGSRSRGSVTALGAVRHKEVVLYTSTLILSPEPSSNHGTFGGSILNLLFLEK